MALAGALGRAGTPPERLDVSADVTFDKLDAGWRVVSSALTRPRRGPRACRRRLRRGRRGDAKDGCPISIALGGNVALSVEATLEG